MNLGAEARFTQLLNEMNATKSIYSLSDAANEIKFALRLWPECLWRGVGVCGEKEGGGGGSRQTTEREVWVEYMRGLLW